LRFAPALALLVLSLSPPLVWATRSFAQVPASTPAGAAAPEPNDADALAARVEADFKRIVAAAQANAQSGAAPAAPDCETACRALESMRRATEHLCAAEPGQRCVDAQDKLDNATQRVRASCPMCAIPTRPVEAPAAGTTKSLESTTPAAGTTRSLESAAEREEVRKRGGCAGCTTATDTARADAFAAAAFGASLLAVARRRRRRPR
jgi:hypothetical protein